MCWCAFDTHPDVSYKGTRRSILRKEEESSLYACPQHTVEPAQLARMCAALSPGSRKGPFLYRCRPRHSDELFHRPKPARAELLDGMSHRVLSQRVVSDAGHLVSRSSCFPTLRVSPPPTSCPSFIFDVPLTLTCWNRYRRKIQADSQMPSTMCSSVI